MPLKYQCPRCERRFVDWGAEKLGFKCPDCVGEELVRVGVREDQILQPPKLKRRPKPAGRSEDDEYALAGFEYEVEDEEVEEIEVLGIASDEVDVPLVSDYDEAAVPDEEELDIKVEGDVEEVVEELPPDIEFEEAATPPFDAVIEEFPEDE